MFIRMLKKIFFLNKKNDVSTTSNDNIKNEPIIRDIEINVSKHNNFVIFEIMQDCNLKEFMKAREKYAIYDIEKDISNNTLFDGSFDKINRKQIYIIKQSNYLYNIYINESAIHINERITYEEKDFFVDERIIHINKLNNTYKISRMKHDKSRSTFYVKFFSSDKPKEQFFNLGQSEALKISLEIIENLAKIISIEKIINLEHIYNFLTICNDSNIENSLQKDNHISDNEVNPIKKLIK